MLTLTQKEVCEILEISPTILKKRIETGDYPPIPVDEETERVTFTVVWLDAAKKRQENLQELRKQVQKKIYG